MLGMRLLSTSSSVQCWKTSPPSNTVLFVSLATVLSDNVTAL